MAYSTCGTPGELPARSLAWLYKDSQTGEVLGPSVIETLCTLWRCGELNEESLVKPEGAARYVRIRDAPALLGILQTQPPSPAALRGGADYNLSRAGRETLDSCAHSVPVRLEGTHASAPRRDELRAERAELTRARAQLEADVAEFERWRSDTLKLIASQRALLSGAHI